MQLNRRQPHAIQRQSVQAALGASLLALVLAPAAWGQDSEADLRQEIETLKQGQQQMQQQLQQITRLLKSRPSAPSGPQINGTTFDLGENLVQGAKTAELTLIEFTDYQ